LLFCFSADDLCTLADFPSFFTSPCSDAPIVRTTSCNVNENTQMGTSVCSLVIQDPDGVASGRFSWAFEEVPDLFVINPTNGAITVGDVTRLGGLNFEGKASYRYVSLASASCFHYLARATHAPCLDTD
jgi:hypothetical protein